MSQLTKSVEAQVSGTIWAGISSFAKAALEYIFNSDRAKLQELTENFIQSARDEHYSVDLIDQLLAAAGRSVINDSGDKIKDIPKDSFGQASIARLIGVGVVALRPKELFKACDSLQAYALSAGHRQDKLFSTDGRAHLILAITAIIGRIFSLADPNLKIQWLKLTEIFVDNIIASEFIRTSDWSTRMGISYTTFFEELRNLQTVIKSTIDHLKANETLRPVLMDYVNTINVQIDAAQFNTGAVMGVFWKTALSNMANGRPRISDLMPPTLIGTFMDAMGCTLVPPSDAKATKKKETIYSWLPITQQYMDWIIAWSSASSKSLAEDTPDFPFPEAYKKPREEKAVVSNLKNAQFLSAFEDLINKDRIRLDEKGHVVLYVYKRPETSMLQKLQQTAIELLGFSSGDPELYSLQPAIPMGLDLDFLKLKPKEGQSTTEHEAAQEAHRKNILKAEVFKARTMNAILGLIELCDCTRNFLDDYGMVKAAIFLQKLFPSMLTLIDAASRQHGLLIETLDQLKGANPQIAHRIANGMGFFRKMAENLKVIKDCAEKGKKALGSKLEDVSSGKVSMAIQLEAIGASLKNCHILFSASNMLQSTEVASLEKELDELLAQIQQAKSFDDADKLAAKKALEAAAVAASEKPKSSPALVETSSVVLTKLSQAGTTTTPLNNFPAGLSETSGLSNGMHASPFQPTPAPAIVLAPSSAVLQPVDSKAIIISSTSFKELIVSQKDPITALLNLAMEKEKSIDDPIILRKLYAEIINSLASADKSKEIFNSPKIFKLGLHLCKKFNKEKKPEVYALLLEKFPEKIKKIIIGVHGGKRFIFNSQKKEWNTFNLYVSRDASGFFQTYNGVNATGDQAQMILAQFKETEFFTMSCERWPKHLLYVYGGLDGTVKGNREYDSGAQAHFSLTPHNNGEYFTLATQEWPKAKLYISKDVFGIARSKEGDRGDRSHVGITPYEPAAAALKK